MKRYYAILLACMSLGFARCHKSESTTGPVTSGSIKISVNYKVGANALIFDSLVFANKAGNVYSIEKLQYYLSGFRFYNGGQLKFTSKEVFFCDARDTVSNFELTDFTGMQAGSFDSIAFYIGVAPSLNTSNSLPATMENIDMGWPDAMGGGYHFLKIEGHWKNGSLLSGYAMHIGGNNYAVRTGVKYNLVIYPTANAELHMTMDVNQWYETPGIYNFSTDGTYSMGNVTLMQKLSENGVDVLTVN